ncbi:hypothetical protein MKX08_008368 [Trichoderma sp. CBMAI-0020]|nr:hypothetical protein MKX08_008368 [Trichoderma sp. CBMAI-0020]
MEKTGKSSEDHSYDSLPVVEAEFEVQNHPSAYKRYAVYSPSEWLLESISSSVALGLVVALVTIFWSMDNQPLSAWKSHISLNTSISILTTAYAMALMHGVSTFIGQSKWLHFSSKPRRLADLETFDQASRGVWGSAMLLTTVKWNLATIGAVITILRLSFSPFAQQVVLVEQRNVISFGAGAVTFGYAHGYSREAVFNRLSTSVTESIPQDAGMQSAVFQGLYGVNITEPFSCPGVCRWPGSYVSLGFKAECRNVTQQTLQTSNCDNQAMESHQCNMTTPGGVMVGARIVLTDEATAYYMNATSLVDVDKVALDLSDSFPEITRFVIYRSTPDHSFQMQNINVTECSLSITAYEYTDAKANGSDFSFASRREVDFGVKNPWFLMNQNATASFRRLTTNETTSGNIHVPALEIDSPNIQTLQNFLTSTSIISEFVEGNYKNTNLGVAAALIGDVDLNARFDGMATAMTNYIRYGPNSRLAHGEVIQSEPFVSIRWEYFAVPLAIEALAIVFAILSIFNNRRSRNVPLWKSSTLAVLACQHNEQLELLQTTCKGIDEIQFEAETLKVQLQ